MRGGTSKLCDLVEVDGCTSNRFVKHVLLNMTLSAPERIINVSLHLMSGVAFFLFCFLTFNILFILAVLVRAVTRL